MNGKFIIVGLLLLFICTNQSKPQIISNWNVDTTFYLYYPDPNAEKIIRERIDFKNSLDRKEILDSLAGYLTSTYFIPKKKYFEGKQKVSIDIQKMNKINIAGRNYLIATVNINDPDKICMESYFQGSAGGRISFLMLVANLFQPQLKYPLIDAALFLYNGAEIEEMDHINLFGIISEREVDSQVRKAIRN